MRKIFENAVWWSGVVVIGLVLGISLQFVRAWQEPPPGTPPEGNVDAPLNTGPAEQLKQGALGILGLLKLYGGLQIPTGAGAGKVLTSDANGVGTWQPAGGVISYTYTYYCFNNNDIRWGGTPVCADSGESRGYCPVGETQVAELGEWGTCLCPMPNALYTFLPPGSACGTVGSCPSPGSPATVISGKAYVCAK